MPRLHMVAAQPVTMTHEILTTLQWYAAAVAILTLFAGAAIYWLWRPRGGIPRDLLGPQRWRAVPWQLPEVLMAMLVMYFGVYLVLSLPFLHHQLSPEAFEGFEISNAYGLIVGPFDEGLAAGLSNFVGTLTAYPHEVARRVSETRLSMIVQLILSPLLIWLVVYLMRRLVNARPYQFGIHLNRWRENLTAGCVGWLLAVPIVVVVFLAVNLDFWDSIWGPPTEHPVSRFITANPSFWTWFLSAVTILLVAPVTEEFLFRGIIQPYLVRWPAAADVLILLTIALAIWSLIAAGNGTGLGVGPLLYVFVVAIGYYGFERVMWPWLPELGAARGIFATSLFFAAVHFPVWPSPIPLFFLSLFLGFLAFRTGSLVGPITLHALFNATGLIVKYMAGQVR